MTKEEIAEEIKSRILADVHALGGNLPERFSLAWHGYLAALLEWQIIEIPQYDDLFEMLPEINDPNPVTTIFSGREDE
ncbi:MAG: hypothetical protein ACR2F2_10870 [Pyrinomonadaceae bacterium]